MRSATPNQVFIGRIITTRFKGDHHMEKVHFVFEGQTYEVGMEAYDKGLPIRLPDGRVLTVSTWFESMPPQPGELKILECVEASATTGE